MDIFISWSGNLSRDVAVLMREWLSEVIQATRPFMSEKDVDGGAVWFAEIYEALNRNKFAVVCLSRDNIAAPWLLFEAGALAKGLSQSRVCPVLIDMEKSDLAGPLAQLQAKILLDQDQMRELVESINKEVPEGGRLPEAALKKSFQRTWSDFEEKIRKVLERSKKPRPAPVRRPTEDILEELVDAVRVQNDRIMKLEFALRDQEKDRFVNDLRLFQGSAGAASEYYRQRLAQVEFEPYQPDTSREGPRGPQSKIVSEGGETS